jgi:hypothetical protein
MVRPVELQDNLSKTKLLEQVQHLQKSAPEEAQKQFAQELAKKTAHDLHDVPTLPQADKIIIHRDKNKKDDGQKKNPKDKEKKPGDDQQDESSPKIDFVA